MSLLNLLSDFEPNAEWDVAGFFYQTHHVNNLLEDVYQGENFSVLVSSIVLSRIGLSFGHWLLAGHWLLTLKEWEQS